ncbi:germination protein YpeB [Fodinisporobacter ferrooxydans]|uniref:Germination protein YpeB n=1 Tax=Fodinisporobacter ferrooxydans TaxID=2901836 RepID=A0ABY4CGZ2_9BACL|nr:germination protein YpeB [Alicyclobacillaceae bacterium MYW30-H2]
MYRRMANWLLPVLAIGLMITGIWGFQQSRQKSALLIQSENHYQQAFHDLAYQMDQLQNELGKSLAVGSENQFKKSMNSIWRMTYMAQNDVGELPLTLMPFHKTQAFLHDLGTFAYQAAAAKPLDAAQVTEQQWRQLKQFYQESKAMEANVKHVQTAVLNDGARWTDAEQALAAQGQKQDNVIIDGFQQLEKKVSQFPEIHWGPTENQQTVRSEKPDTSHLTGSMVNAEQAKQQAAKFLGRTDLENLTVVKNGPGMPYPAYSVTATTADGVNSYLELAQKGAHVTWFLHDRSSGKPTIDLNRGEELAAKWLKDHQYSDMQPVSIEQYDNIGVYQFCYAPQGIVHYSEKMAVKVALDNGDIIGFQAKDYLFHQTPGLSLQPKLTEANARAKVNGHLQIQQSNLVVVPDEKGKEVLAYEFLGTMDRDTYKVYVNANTGEEIGVEKLTNQTSTA